MSTEANLPPTPSGFSNQIRGGRQHLQRLLIVGLTILVVAVIALLASPAGAHPDAAHLVGSWEVRITTTVDEAETEWRTLMTFKEDGTLVTSELVPVGTSRGPERSTSGHGAWTSLGGAKYTYTFTSLQVDTEGQFAGSLQVQGHLTLNPDLNAWSGPVTLTPYDAEGNIAQSETGTAEGALITIEPLVGEEQ
jgi:hypothetical protein